MACASTLIRFSNPAGRMFTSCSSVGVNWYRKNIPLMKSSQLSMHNLSLLNLKKEDGYGIIEMNRKPVNSLSLEMITELSSVIDDLEGDKSCQGLILTSALPKVFCAGLDITEFLQTREDRLQQFSHAFQNVWLKLYGSRLATVAAINGAAPAGGCLLAVSCDYRMMVDGFVIGPNETQLGIVAPPWFRDTLLNTVGHRNTELLLSLGQLLSSTQALSVGLVDSNVQDDVVGEAVVEMKKWMAIPAEARVQTKMMLRNPILEKLRKGREEDTKLFMDLVRKDSTQKIITGYLKKLSEKSKNK